MSRPLRGFIPCLLAAGLALSGPPAVRAAGPGSAAPDTLVQHIAALDFEQLLDMKVTLGSRTPEKWYRSPSAMYVITGEDIRRSGLTLVPELLRLAPGVQVARIDANKWKIAIRGFNERFSSKLLVLVDGRIVYTQLFSGVYWDVQDLPIEDIDRIEVVRGPGGALWGSNAVNGIINIVTRNAADTRGGLVVATAGDEATRAQFSGRYGFGGERLDVRLYGRYTDQDAGAYPQDGRPDTGGSYTPGAAAGDGWQQWHAGFRGDWRANERDNVSFFGDLYQGEFGQTRVLALPAPTTLPDTVEAAGGYVGLHWQRKLSAGSDLGLRLYYDHTFREDEGLWEKRDTYTADFQHRMTLGSHELMWGGEYRASADETRRRSTVYFDPASRTLRRGTVFVQDRIALDAAHVWSVTVGSKFEANNVSDFEVQPSLRLLWAPSDRTSAWTAVSRAVRTPSRANSDLYLEPMPGVMVPLGNPDLESEEVTAWEAGGRHMFTDRFFVDVALFVNDYDGLIDDNRNQGAANSAGGELAARCEVTSAWTLAANWSYIDFSRREPPSVAVPAPRHMVGLRSCLDLPHDLALDAAFYYTDPNADTVPATDRLDLRLGWRPHPRFELSLSGLYLLDEAATEARGGTRLSSDAQRSFHATARIGF